MARFVAVCVLVSVALTSFASTKKQPPVSDPRAVAFAQQSIAAITGLTTISDVTLTGSATWTAGSDEETGTATFHASGTGESRMDLELSSGTRIEIRDASTGSPLGKWIAPKTSGNFAFHNCWTDAAWFFPALSSLSQTANPNFIFSYVGQEEHDGVPAQHIRVYQTSPVGLTNSPLPRLSRLDFYLDATSYLPIAVAFKAHTDRDMNTNIPTEIRFTDYQLVSGVQVPFHLQRILNGTVLIDATVTNAVFNTGLPPSLFNVQ
jgi:hypothetical protein